MYYVGEGSVLLDLRFNKKKSLKSSEYNIILLLITLWSVYVARVEERKNLGRRFHTCIHTDEYDIDFHNLLIENAFSPDQWVWCLNANIPFYGPEMNSLTDRTN